MRKALRVLAAAAAIAAAAAVCVVAAAFALYALVEPYVGPAGGGAVVAGAAALFLLLAGLYAKGRAQGPRSRHEPDASFVERAMDIARKRPLLAAGAAVAAGLYAIRHPALIAAVMGAVMENKSRKD